MPEIQKDPRTAGVFTKSDKVPEHAKLVIDDEKQAKLILDLKRQIKEINLENIKVSQNI